jgi:hypothetical protein
LHSFKDLVKNLRNSCDDALYALDPDGVCEQDCTWYEHEKDLKEFSKKYPSIVFELSGIGEEHDDIWNKYFKNGKMQSCIAHITFEKYDEDKLKE